MKVQIPNPCSQKWEDMLPDESNRFCQACQKTIINFSTMSDAEIMRHLEQASGKVCGRFHHEQLDRYLVQDYRKSFFLSKGMAALLSLFSFSGIYAQQIKTPDNSGKTVQTNNSEKAVPDSTKKDKGKSVIKGTITDKGNGDPIPFATILITGSKTGCTSDMDGNYSLTVPDSLIKNEISLTIRLVGYETTTKNIFLKKGSVQLENFQLNNASHCTGDIVIVVEKKNFFQRIFGKKKKHEPCK